ncbi:MAG TPA: phosphoglucosamine mutase [Candidatus Binatia bacterium]|nr:phosphoglucosamine mutase [Candidatus Binatia bacterium]
MTAKARSTKVRERKLFGTDGIRGVANVEPMTAETALRLGRAAAHVFKRDARRHKIIIGKDTRISGYLLESALTSGMCSMGVDVLLVGPMPTPAIAFLTRSLRADAGVVISASHNPFQDNGIKFFAETGFKLPDEVEAEIEHFMADGLLDAFRPTAEGVGKAFRIDDALGRYNVFVKQGFPRELTLEGLRIAVDCAHGAAYRVAPEVLQELGAHVVALGVDPDGHNINRDCGALHPGRLQAAVRRERAHVGIALDGDADRCILVDETGDIVDGDEILGMLADDLLAQNRLPQQTVVATVMSNLGLEIALRQRGARLVRVPVGDRYVVEEMRRTGCALGGEQSGHIVLLEYSTTGDGLLTALQVLAVLVKRGRPLSELRRIITRLPQRLENVRVRERRELTSLPPVQQVIDRITASLGERGRVLVRYSGTEPLLRVMVEAERVEQVNECVDEIAGVIRKHLAA